MRVGNVGTFGTSGVYPKFTGRARYAVACGDYGPAHLMEVEMKKVVELTVAEQRAVLLRTIEGAAMMLAQDLAQTGEDPYLQGWVEDVEQAAREFAGAPVVGG